MASNQETILEPDLAIIDAHHHLIDTGRHAYTLDKYKEDCASGHNIVGSVYIEVREKYYNAVSYTHLTLPTKRIV